MEDFFDMNQALAQVYLINAGDKKNIAMVSDEKLLVVRKGRRKVYHNNRIRAVTTGDKKLLFPLLLGGVLAPFSFVSFFVQVFHPLVHLVFTLLGLLLFFIGWMGKPTFELILKNGEEEYFYLPTISRNLEAFIDYVNTQFQSVDSEGITKLIFVEADPKDFSWLYGESKSNQNFFPKAGYTYHQLLKDANLQDQVVGIDPQAAGKEISFEYDQKSESLRPVLNGPVSLSAVVPELRWTTLNQNRS